LSGPQFGDGRVETESGHRRCQQDALTDCALFAANRLNSIKNGASNIDEGERECRRRRHGPAKVDECPPSVPLSLLQCAVGSLGSFAYGLGDVDDVVGSRFLERRWASSDAQHRVQRTNAEDSREKRYEPYEAKPPHRAFQPKDGT
jgi:hypothetical protein